MTSVQRYDRGQLKNAVRTPEGYYLVEGYVARPGVLEYVRADGSVQRELVPEEELHRTDSLETLARKPVTLEHPTRDGAAVFVDSESIPEFETGDVDGEVVVEGMGGFVKVKMAVRRKDAVQAIERGVRELSPGYTCDLDPTPGEHPEHGRYDAIQRNRRYNHVAITVAGRAGSQVGLRADSAAQITPFEAASTPTEKEPTMAEIEAKLNEALARRDAEDRTKRLEAENEELKKKVDELQGKVDAMEKKDADDKDNGEEKKTDALDTRLAWFQQRQDALAVAGAMGVQVPEKADVGDIRRAVVSAFMGGSLRQDASDDYVSAAYDIARAQAAQRQRNDAYNGISTALMPGGAQSPVQQQPPAFQQQFGQPPQFNQPPQPSQRQDALEPEDAMRANLDKMFRGSK